MGFVVVLAVMIGLFLAFPRSKWRRHKPYMALRGRADRMIRRGDLPDIEALRDRVRAGCNRIAMHALEESKRSKLGQTGVVCPDIGPLVVEIFTETQKLWPSSEKRGMTVQEIAELASILDLVQCNDDDVEAMVSRFRDPAAARALRARADGIRAAAKRYQAESTRLRDAMNEWVHNGNIARYHDDHDLVGILSEMSPHDTDLWHMIACESELGDPTDEPAIFWFCAQPDCDQATVAAFLMRYASLGYLSYFVERQASKGETTLADKVAVLVERWNAGFYAKAELALDPGGDKHPEFDKPEDAARAFAEETAKASAILGREAWGIPEGLFRSFEGRDPKPTLHFRHGDGLMVLPPRREDYLSAEWLTVH